MYIVCLCVYTYMHRCVYSVCVWICFCVCIYVYMCVHICAYVCRCVCVCRGEFGKRNVRGPDLSGSDEETVSTVCILCSQHHLGFLTLGRAGEEHARRLPVKDREAKGENISWSVRGRCQGENWNSTTSISGELLQGCVPTASAPGERDPQTSPVLPAALLEWGLPLPNLTHTLILWL